MPIGTLAGYQRRISWTVPDMDATGCKIHMNDRSSAGTDQSDRGFAIIVELPALDVIKPNGGEVRATSKSRANRR